ncbi:MAG TPA: hypothetical protein VM933_03755 [Acidimicrobiales bacterium]|nr:hypothetical protein [Acidimicrobiales bacterium]
MALVRSAIEFLRSRDLDDESRRELEDAIDGQMTLVVDALTDLARGLPAEALNLLHTPRVTAIDLIHEGSVPCGAGGTGTEGSPG